MGKGKLSKLPKAAKWVAGIIATLVAAFSTCSCSSAYPVAGATAAGTVAAFTMPLAVPLAIPAGYGIGLLAEQDATGEEQAEQLDEIAAGVKALTTGDVEALVAVGVAKKLKAEDEAGGMLATAREAIYDFIKLAIAAVVALVLCVLGYVLYRKGVGKKFYAKLNAITGDDEDTGGHQE